MQTTPIINIVDNDDQALCRMQSFIAKNNLLSFDVETTGLSVRTDKVIGFSLTTVPPAQLEAHYLIIGRFDPVTKQVVFTDRDRSIAKGLLDALQGKQLITWNGAFDMPITKYDLGIDLVPSLAFDAMLLYHSCNEEGVPWSHTPFSLKTVAAYFYGKSVLGEQADLAASIKANGGSKKQVCFGDPVLVAKYGCQDGLLTSRIFADCKADAQKQNVWQHYVEEKMVLYREVTIPMEQTGLRLDMPLLLQARAEITLDLQNLNFKIQQAIKPHLSLFTDWFLNKDFPPARTGAFAQGIAAYYDLPLPLTPGGAYQMTAKTLATLPDSLPKQVLLEKAYLPADDIVKIQKLLFAQTQEDINQDAGPMFNLLSKPHLKKLFFDTLNEAPLSRTPTGQPQVDDDFLATMVAKHSWVADLQLYNRLTKLKGTYIDRFIQESENGRFYPSFFQHRTVSNRYGSDIQQMPRKLRPNSDNPLVIKYTNLVRDFIIADEGCILIGADYESLEPHVFAHVSKEPVLIKLFNDGTDDFYSTICLAAEKLEGFSSVKSAANYLGAIAKEIRDRAKKYALGIPYGETPYKLKFELNCSKEEAQHIWDGYWKGLPVLKQSVDAAHTELLKYGFVTIESGFRRHMPRAKTLYAQYGDVIKCDLKLWKKYHENAPMYERAKKDRREFKNYMNNSFNVKIQGLSASIINQAAIDTNRKLQALSNPWPVLMQIHDELVTQAPLRLVEQVKAALSHGMVNARVLSVPLKAVPNTGRCYGDLK